MAADSDEMDNDVPDTLGKIVEDDDEDREEDIEESESLMIAAPVKPSQTASSIRDFTQTVPKGPVTQDPNARQDVSVPTGKAVNGKPANATLGTTRITRSSLNQMTYSTVSKKRASSVLAGNDMESFTSTQEDAIYGKRSALKKQRK